MGTLTIKALCKSYSVELALLYVLGATYNAGVTIYTVIKFRKGEAVH